MHISDNVYKYFNMILNIIFLMLNFLLIILNIVMNMNDDIDRNFLFEFYLYYTLSCFLISAIFTMCVSFMYFEVVYDVSIIEYERLYYSQMVLIILTNTLIAYTSFYMFERYDFSFVSAIFFNFIFALIKNLYAIIGIAFGIFFIRNRRNSYGRDFNANVSANGPPQTIFIH